VDDNAGICLCQSYVGCVQAEDRSRMAGWRDLSRSKWRLAKGEEQLAATFANSAHHVADDALSELAACIYKVRLSNLLLLLSACVCAAFLLPKRSFAEQEDRCLIVAQARRLPKALLTKAVRTVFVAGEYPATLGRLYDWSPDEAIPEFYADASVFESLHDDMPSLQVPDWAVDAQDFVQQHR